MRGKLQLRERMLQLRAAGLPLIQSLHARQKHGARIARRQSERGVERSSDRDRSSTDSIFL